MKQYRILGKDMIIEAKSMKEAVYHAVGNRKELRIVFHEGDARTDWKDWCFFENYYGHKGTIEEV